FGEGHLVFAKVMRSRNRQQGLVFETPLVRDGQGGLRTMHPVSAYTLRATRLPEFGETESPPVPQADNSTALESLRSKFGLPPCPAPVAAERDSDGASAKPQASTRGPGHGTSHGDR